MKRSSITRAIALSLIALGGFLAGRISHRAGNPGRTDEPNAGHQLPRPDKLKSAGTGARAHRARGVRSANPPLPAGKALADRLEAILRSDDPLERKRAMLALIDRLPPGEIPGVIAAFQEFGVTDEREDEYVLLLAAWAQADPESALAHAEEQSEDYFESDTMLASWASVDPDAALEWANNHHEGTGANPHMVAVIRAIAATDSTRATQLLAAMPRSLERRDALLAMQSHILRQGPEHARTWIDSLEEGTLRNSAMDCFSTQLAASDPAGTVNWLISSESGTGERSISNVYQTWAASSEREALASIASVPAGEMRDAAVRGMISGVAGKDVRSAIQLMDQHPDQVDDRTVRVVTSQAFASDPMLAVSQIGRITNASDRDNMYVRYLRIWLERDPDTAKSWMKSNFAPEAVRQHPELVEFL